jgi:hypothetical protein
LFDPEPDFEQTLVGMAAGDQLEADRQAVRAMAGRQRQTGHVKLRPQRIENR